MSLNGIIRISLFVKVVSVYLGLEGLIIHLVNLVLFRG